MPESGVIEPPAAEAPDKSATTNVGDVYRKALSGIEAKETATEAAPVKELKGQTFTKEQVAVPAAPGAGKEPTEKAAKPSPIDVVLGDKTEPAKPEEEPDVLKEFDEKKANWPKARETMARQSQEKKTLAGEVDRLKGELGKLNPKADEELNLTKTQLAALTKERDDMLEALTATNYELTPQYQKEFVEGYQSKIEKLSTRIKSYGGNPEAVINALQSPVGKFRDQAVEEASKELPETALRKIEPILSEIEDLDERRYDHRKDPKVAWEAVEQKRLAADATKAEEAERVRSSEFQKVAEALPEKSPFLRNIEGEAEWNDGIKADVENAKRMFGKDAQFQELVQIAIKGSRYDALEKMLIDTHKELRSAQKQLKEYDESAPDVKGGKVPPAKPSTDPVKIFHEELAKRRRGDEGM
jgi:hypothetical protein